MEAPDEIAPVPVAALAAWRRIVGGLLIIAVWLGVAFCVYSLLRPRIVVDVAGDQTTIRLGPEMFHREVAALAAAILCGVTSRFVLGWRSSAALGLLLALLLPVAVWHQNAARVVLTPDTLTAPTEGRLTPGPETTVRFDQIAMLWLSGRDSGVGSKLQYCQMKDGRRIALELGPLIDRAGHLIDNQARQRGVKVTWAR